MWLNSERDSDFVSEGYEMVHGNRQNKSGGGVALLIGRNLEFRMMGNMSTVGDNMFECISVETHMKKKKYDMRSCIYRTPRSNINASNESHKQIRRFCSSVGILTLIFSIQTNTKRLQHYTTQSELTSKNHQIQQDNDSLFYIH